MDYADATITTDAASATGCALSKKEAVNALKVAKRCNEMLSGQIDLWPSENVNLSYRRAAIERGFAECPSSTSISQSKLEDAFVSFYGEGLLSKIGCQIRPGTGNSWINTIFQKQKSLFHPVEHALVQIFLESVPVETSFNPFGFGPWKCPNPYAQHEGQSPITKLKLLDGSKGQRIASAKCNCGFEFTFQRTSDDDPLLPVVKRINAFGPTWAAKVKRLKKSGLTTYAIGKKMGIAYITVQHLLNSKPIDHQPSTEQIKKWRKTWMKLLDAVPNRSRAIAREKDWKLYNRLLKYDREWLYAQPKNKTRNPHPEGQVNWASRDKEWSQLLKTAASKIREETPLARVTKNAMITQAGISTSILSYLDRLPACRLALSECSESWEAFRERRN